MAPSQLKPALTTEDLLYKYSMGVHAVPVIVAPRSKVLSASSSSASSASLASSASSVSSAPSVLEKIDAKKIAASKLLNKAISKLGKA